MNDNLKIALCSLNSVWENPKANFIKIEKLMKNIEADILILPEMFATGFSTNIKKIAQSNDGQSVFFMKKLASAMNFVVCGSLPIYENEKYYNRFFWVEPNGMIKTYDKHHLFSYDSEDKFYTAGKIKLTFEYKGWKICPLICYDLRFPVWSRNVENNDLYIYVANWPEAREDAWNTLLKARAIENMAYVAGVNRSGTDGNNFTYKGASFVFNGLGKMLCGNTINPSIKIVTINKSELIKQREFFGFLKDKKTFLNS